MFQLVCVQYGVVSVPYFLDEMKPYELSVICESLHLRHKEEWEQARMISYVIAQSNSKKKLKPTDIIKFAWEKENSESKTPSHTYTADEVENIKAMALQREKELKEKGII